MLGLNESDVVYDENAGLADLCQLLNGTLWRLYAVVASVKCHALQKTQSQGQPRLNSMEAAGSN